MRINLSAPSTTHLWLLVAVSAFAWSFGPICIRYAFEYDMPPALVSFGRMITGAVMFAPYIWVKGAREIAVMPARSRWLALVAGGHVRRQYCADGGVAGAYQRAHQPGLHRDHPDLGRVF